MGKMVLPKILRLARAVPPRCVQSFETDFTAEYDVVPTAIFRIGCKSCPGESFSILERKIMWSGGVTSTGLVLLCRACQARVDLFDMRHDGYDGEFNHNDFITGPQLEETFTDEFGQVIYDVKVRVALIYNNKIDELKSDAMAAKRRPQDLFDSFTLDVDSAVGWINAVWKWECA